MTALAPIRVAFLTRRSRACRRVSSRSSVYSLISPPPSDRSPAIRLPEKPRLRTTSPKTWPFVSVTRWPAMNGAVATITAGPSFVVVGPLASTPCALLAGAALTKQAERVEPGVMAVAPVGRDGVVADEMDVGERRLLRGQGRPAVEPAGHPGLAPAERARAEPTQRRGLVERVVAVGPFDREGPGSPIGVDLQGSGRRAAAGNRIGRRGARSAGRGH